MSVENLKPFFDWAGIIFVGLTVVTGAIALWMGSVVHEREAAHIRAQSEQIAAQQERAAIAEHDLLALQQQVQRVQPRGITPKQQADLVAALSGDPKGPVDIWYITSDGEAGAFAIRIAEVLRLAGWATKDPNGHTLLGGPPSTAGLFILVNSEVNDEMPAPAFVDRLYQAFDGVGITVVAHRSHLVRKDAAALFVSNKP